METKTDSLKCVRNIRSTPLQAYRLPDDGRQWMHDAEARRNVAMQLATYANADGSGICPSTGTLASDMGRSLRTIKRRLKELRELNFLKDIGFSAARYKHTRIRSLDIEAILRAGATVVPSSSSVVPASRSTVVPSSSSLVPTSLEKLAETREDGTQPSRFTDLLTVPPTVAPTGAGWEGWIVRLPSELDGAVPNREQRGQIEQQLQQHGSEVMAAAIQRWIEVREMDIAGLRSNKWGAWLRECAPHIRWATQQKQEADEKQKNAAAVEASVLQQMTEHAKFMEYKHPLRDAGEDPDECMKG